MPVLANSGRPGSLASRTMTSSANRETRRMPAMLSVSKRSLGRWYSGWVPVKKCMTGTLRP